MLLLVSCWEGLIRRPLTACVFAGHRVVSRGSFHRSFRQSFQESKFQQHRFKSVSSSVIQERFLSVSTVIRGRQVQYVAAVIRGRQVRYTAAVIQGRLVRHVAAVIRVRSVCQDVAVQFVCVKFDKSWPSLRTSSSTRRCRSSCTSSSSRRCRTVRVSSTSSRCSSVRVSSSRCIRLKTLLRASGPLPTLFQYAWLGRTSGTTSVYEYSLSGFHYRQQTDDEH